MYFGLFVLCGILSGLPYSIFNRDPSIVTVGISGAVSAVIGAYFILYPLTKIRLFFIYKLIEVPTIVCLGLWFLLHLVGPLLPGGEGVAKTAWIAPIFGFLIGAVVAFVKKSALESK